MSPKPAAATPSHKPWIWLQKQEPFGIADACVCRLEADGPNGTPGAAFYMCPLHQQAPAVLLNALYALDPQAAALERGHFGRSDVPQAIAAIRKVLASAQAPLPKRAVMKRSEAAAAYLAALKQLGRDYRSYVHVCPFCGAAPIYVTSFTADCSLPVRADGWDTTDSNINTDDEMFTCTSCHRSIDPAYVHGEAIFQKEDAPTTPA